MNNLPTLINSKYIVYPNEIEKYFYNIFLDNFFFSDVTAQTQTKNDKLGHMTMFNWGQKNKKVSIKFLNSMMLPKCNKITNKSAECIVCFDKTKYKTFCNHAVCDNCVTTIVQKNKGFTCPYCRHEYTNHLFEITLTHKDKKKLFKKYSSNKS